MKSEDIKIIAFYLPQYYPTETNNKWYGEGFTEWTNVGRAKKLFRGHYQPKVPADLGYYDLRISEVRKKQVALAQEAGISGFCYYHYWFGNGRVELDLPLKKLLEEQEPQFPFMLCWANQSWYAKFWNCNVDERIQHTNNLIAEQTYPGVRDIINHFYYLLPAFKDNRYIKQDEKILFMIYRPLEYKEVKEFISIWQRLANKNGLKGFYFVGQASSEKESELILELGFDGVNLVRKDDFLKDFKYNNIAIKLYKKGIRFLGGAPYHYKYKNIYKTFVKENGIENRANIFPTIIPNWDHSPRSGKRGVVFHDSHPKYFKLHLKDVFSVLKGKNTKERIVFLKSWNEWGEGNYMEPDLKYGKGYIEKLRECLDEI